MIRLLVTDIPLEVWLDNILPVLPLHDVLTLGCASRFFYLLTSDEFFWHRKLQQDFNFSGSDTARATGWKFIYKRLRNPGVYVWGDAGHNRLGLPNIKPQGGGLPTPTRLRIPGVQIVNIVAGGMSFHALDVHGNVFVWGCLDGTGFALNVDGFSQGGKRAESPMRLKLPVPIRTLSCGRLHTASLDALSNIWTFINWGRPFRLTSPLLDKSSPESTPIQVESGWSYTAILMQSGDVMAYWPYGEAMQAQIVEKFRHLEENEPASRVIPSRSEPNVIPCYAWDLSMDPFRLPPIPYRLPELSATGLNEEANAKETKLVKIAGLDNNLIGLTNKGHVLKYNKLVGEATYQRGEWEYLPNFSELQKIAEDVAFSQDSENALKPPQSLQITHISAHFKTFVAYSAGPQSVVLMGTFDTEEIATPFNQPPLRPLVHRNLQYQSVISVVLGDYHYGALTATGKLLTWGSYSKGALGLGNPAEIPIGQPGGFLNEQHRLAAISRPNMLLATPPDVQEPTEVRFDHADRKREKYCFAATAAGWHMGALVIDVDPDLAEDDDDDEKDAETQPMPGSFPTDPPQSQHPPIPILRGGLGGLSHFRIGYAGRGMYRGRGGIGRGGDPAA